MRAYILIGHIGSGKSSWSKMMASMDLTLIRISSDDIRRMIKDRYVYIFQYEPLVDAFTRIIIREALNENFGIILDDCHHTKKGRLGLCKFIKSIKPNTEIVYVHIKSNLKDSLKRRVNDPHGSFENAEFVWQQISEKHQKIHEKPTKTENQYIDKFMEVDNAKSNWWLRKN